MRIMYDSVTPENILKANPHPQLVGGYINGKYKWSDADWALFPNAVHVRISVRANFLDGDVLDVEVGDATPQEVPAWLTARRKAGADPAIYCNRSTWPQVASACKAAGVAEPHYFIATASGKAEIPAGAVAAQYLLDVAPGIDVSAVADHWPGVDPAPGGAPTSSAAGTSEEDEDDMYPKLEPADNGVHNDTLPWDGRAAVLNVIPTGSMVFVGKPGNWGPHGGTGGGECLVSGVDPSRVDVNQPLQYRIPAGTTRVFYSYSCASAHYVSIKAV